MSEAVGQRMPQVSEQLGQLDQAAAELNEIYGMMQEKLDQVIFIQPRPEPGATIGEAKHPAPDLAPLPAKLRDIRRDLQGTIRSFRNLYGNLEL
jgi:hypothetical protein